MYKNNSRVNSNPESFRDKACSPLQLSCILTRMKPASDSYRIGYYSYTEPLLPQLERTRHRMSDTYFCFSDENGIYKRSMTVKQIRRHPFHVRTTLIMNAGEWKILNSDFRSLKEKYGLPCGKEIKWSYLWSLRHHKKIRTKHTRK